MCAEPRAVAPTAPVVTAAVLRKLRLVLMLLSPIVSIQMSCIQQKPGGLGPTGFSHHCDPARSVQRFQVGNSILMGGWVVLRSNRYVLPFLNSWVQRA